MFSIGQDHKKRKERDDPVMDLFLDIKKDVSELEPSLVAKLDKFEKLLATKLEESSAPKKQPVPLEFSDDDEEDMDESHDPWIMRYMELRDFRIVNGDCKINKTNCSNPKLVKWVTNQKQFYTNLKHNKNGQKLKPERVPMLEALGIEWGQKFPSPVSWEERFEEYKKYKNAMRCDPPVNPSSPTPLGSWVSNQRNELRRYVKGKPSLLTDDQISALNDMDFDWRGPRIK
jgi:Helicase associated domain